MCVCSSQYSELSPHLHPPICFRHDQWPCPCLHLERKALCSQTTRQRPLGRSNGPTKNVFILSICCKCLLYGQAAEVPLKCTSSVATNYETETTTLQNNANGNEHAGKKQRHTSERGHQTIFSKKIKKKCKADVSGNLEEVSIFFGAFEYIKDPTSPVKKSLVLLTLTTWGGITDLREVPVFG